MLWRGERTYGNIRFPHISFESFWEIQASSVYSSWVKQYSQSSTADDGIDDDSHNNSII